MSLRNRRRSLHCYLSNCSQAAIKLGLQFPCPHSFAQLSAKASKPEQRGVAKELWQRNFVREQRKTSGHQAWHRKGPGDWFSTLARTHSDRLAPWGKGWGYSPRRLRAARRLSP